jgi:hypothetical protein
MLFIYEEEEEDYDNMILAYNKMIENMGGDTRFRFETFFMYNHLGYVMWKQDMSPSLTDKLFDVDFTSGLLSYDSHDKLYNGFNLYETRDPFKYSRLVIIEG